MVGLVAVGRVGVGAAVLRVAGAEVVVDGSEKLRAELVFTAGAEVGAIENAGADGFCDERVAP